MYIGCHSQNVFQDIRKDVPMIISCDLEIRSRPENQLPTSQCTISCDLDGLSLWPGWREHVTWMKGACDLDEGSMWPGWREHETWMDWAWNLDGLSMWLGWREHVTWMKEAC